jgi:hypothetical protein
MLRPVLWSCVGLAALLAACGGPTADPPYPVRGRVLRGEKPVAEALVVFHRLAGSQPARKPTGTTDDDGYFTLTTDRTDDGAPAGEYAVTVELRGWITRGEEQVRDGPNQLPARYADPARTDLRCLVRSGKNEAEAFRLSAR